MSAHTPEEVRAEVKVYLLVFGSLAVLTVLTVAASYLEMAFGPHVTIALVIATIKASLVALFFMHLKGEVRPVFWVLLLTGFFFIALMLLPMSGFLDSTNIL